MRMRERLRARGPRGTHGLVQMVGEKVDVLVEATGKMAQDMGKMAQEMSALGSLVKALAKSVDDHEDRITALEKRRK